MAPGSEIRTADQNSAVGVTLLSPITYAEARYGYRLWIRFGDGVEGEVSLIHLVGKGVFEAWTDAALFSRVSVDPETPNHSASPPGWLNR